MKALLILTILTCIILLGCDHSEPKQAIAGSYKKATKEAVVIYYDSVFNKIDACEDAYKGDIDTQKIIGAFLDTLELRLLHSNGIAKKMQYSIFGEDGLREGFATYYFDDSGNLIGNKVTIGTTSLYEVFYHKNDVIIYEKDKSIKINNIDTVGIFSKLAIASCEVSSYMAFFEGMRYTNVQTTTRSMPVLRTFGTVDLKSSPSITSNTIKQLPDNAHLVYLGSNNALYIMPDKQWVWYKVLTEDKITGWVFGHPKNIGLLTDENWE